MAFDDFLVTYPCYFLLMENGQFECVKTAVGQCLCLFTDEDLLDTFYANEHGREAKEFEALVFDRQEQLVGALRCFEAPLADQQVTHIAFDPTPGKRVACGTIREFIEYLERLQEP